MKRLIAVVALAGCFHATHVEKPDQAGGNGQAPPQQAQPRQREGGPSAKPRLARRPQKPGRPPLAASPSALFVPGGVEQVQKALEQRGYLDAAQAKSGDIDAATADAVRKFQADQGIARTGNPDHETMRRLGLDPDQLFRKSSVAQSGSSQKQK